MKNCTQVKWFYWIGFNWSFVGKRAHCEFVIILDFVKNGVNKNSNNNPQHIFSDLYNLRFF